MAVINLFTKEELLERQVAHDIFMGEDMFNQALEDYYQFKVGLIGEEDCSNIEILKSYIMNLEKEVMGV
jgi:hypothetical protein